MKIAKSALLAAAAYLAAFNFVGYQSGSIWAYWWNSLLFVDGKYAIAALIALVPICFGNYLCEWSRDRVQELHK